MNTPHHLPRVITARNPNTALREGLYWLATAGSVNDSRNGPVLVAPGPVLTHYTHPTERVLFSAVRDANPFFHLYECIWMMAGRNDSTSVARYARTMDMFANDQGELAGAYGKRWRSHFGPDQLPLLIDLLRKDPKTRRAVLTMWDPIFDLATVEGSKDVPCFSGDTKLWSPEGDLPMEQVAAKFSEGSVTQWPVYAVDVASKRLSIQWATRVWCSGRKRTLKIIFDDGTELRVTGDHILYRRGATIESATPVRACELSPGDRVLATRRLYGAKGEELFKRNLSDGTGFHNQIKTHREYAALIHGELGVGVDVHHINEVNTDNRSSNLVVMSHSEHSSLHRSGDGNPMRNMTPEQHKARGAKHSEALKKSWSSLTPEQRSARSQGLPMPDNHKVVGVEDYGVEEVYDFTVPNQHNALVGSGIVAHNCNTAVYFDGTDGRLNMTVTNRSNDVVWGAYGANAVHMSFLQEFMAHAVGLPVGSYYQFSNNFHTYVDRPDVARLIEPRGAAFNVKYQPDDRYDKRIKTYALNHGSFDYRKFLQECEHLAEHPTESTLAYTPFLHHVFTPMMRAHREFKYGDYDGAIRAMGACQAQDWRVAGVEWLQRREAAFKKAGAL